MKKHLQKAFDLIHTGALVVVVIVFLVACALIQPWMESQAYNRLTGAQTTVWDAIWIELRVNGESK